VPQPHRWSLHKRLVVSTRPPRSFLVTCGTRHAQLQQHGFRRRRLLAAKALTQQSNLDGLARLYNEAYCRSIGASPARIHFGLGPDTALVGATNVTSVLPTLPLNDFETWHNHLSALQTLAAIGSSVSQLSTGEQRDASHDALPTFSPGDAVLVYYHATHKWELSYRGPFIVHAKSDPSWYQVRKLEDHDNTSAPLIDVHVSRLRLFNMSRTSIAKLLGDRLGPDFGIVTAVLSHRPGPDGALEFEVRWQDDSTSFCSASALSRTTAFAAYVAAHGITPESLRPPPPVATATRGRSRGSRGRRSS
jgi:hypothetical protein